MTIENREKYAKNMLARGLKDHIYVEEYLRNHPEEETNSSSKQEGEETKISNVKHRGRPKKSSEGA